MADFTLRSRFQADIDGAEKINGPILGQGCEMMMELGDMPGMSPIFRSRLGTSSLRRDIHTGEFKQLYVNVTQQRDYPTFALMTFLYERWPTQEKISPSITHTGD